MSKVHKRTHAESCNNPRSVADVQLSKSLSWLLRHKAPSLGLQLSSDGYVPVMDVLTLNHPRFRKDDGQPKYTVEDVARVVENNDKQRFRLEYRDASSLGEDGAAPSNNDANMGKNNNDTDEDTHNKVLCIRANQGHSLKCLQADQLLTPLTKEELSHPSLSIIHGTTRKAWEDHIRHEGLSRMKRNHIHFASGLPPPSAANGKRNTRIEEGGATPISGMRLSSEIYIYINGSKCAKDGILFYRSDNGVILTAGVKQEGMLPVEYFEKVVEASSGKLLL